MSGKVNGSTVGERQPHPDLGGVALAPDFDWRRTTRQAERVGIAVELSRKLLQLVEPNRLS